MSKNVIQSIVIILAILIVIAFLTVIYGMYLKISTKGKNITDLPFIFSSNLTDKEIIKNIQVIDSNNLLILIESDGEIKAGIYDIKNNKITRYIKR